MVLPAGVTKASGLGAALDALGLSPHNVVAVGDAENDHALLAASGCGVAVANAVGTLRGQADWVTEGSRGDGVVELLEALIANDLAAITGSMPAAGVDPGATRRARHGIVLGSTDAGDELYLAPFSPTVLVAGASGSGKSTFTTGLLERFDDAAYQFCIVDPEGDYDELPGAVVLGGSEREPLSEEVTSVLDDPRRSLVVNLLGVALEHRPAFARRLLTDLTELRARRGRPHWIVVDEAHHVFPAGLDRPPVMPSDHLGLVLVTVHPASVERTLLASVRTAIAVGGDAAATLGQLPGVDLGDPAQRVDPLGVGEALRWTAEEPGTLRRFRYLPPNAERRRHNRKYATGELPEDRSFYFRGPEGRLNLRAQNLATFLQMAEGVDDETWLYHLRRGDVERWFAEAIKDDDLAAQAADAAAQGPAASRASIREAVDARYTAPAG
jgi:hypothetical protein